MAGFRLISNERGFAEMRSETALVLLNADRELPEGHPFRDKLLENGMGIGVEIGIVSTDLEAARKLALTFEKWSVTEIALRPWGLSDFRVVSPDGYYLRITNSLE